MARTRVPSVSSVSSERVWVQSAMRTASVRGCVRKRQKNDEKKKIFV